MREPDFLAQSGEPMTPDVRQDWYKIRAKEMQEKGATWFQYSVDDADNPEITLIEGWKDRPAHQPPPHFQIALLAPALLTRLVENRNAGLVQVSGGGEDVCGLTETKKDPVLIGDYTEWQRGRMHVIPKPCIKRVRRIK